MLSPDVKSTAPPVDSTVTPLLTTISSSGGGSGVVLSVAVSVVVPVRVPALVMLTEKIKGLLAVSVVVVPPLAELASPSTAAMVRDPVLVNWTAPAVLLKARLVTALLASARVMPAAA